LSAADDFVKAVLAVPADKAKGCGAGSTAVGVAVSSASLMGEENTSLKGEGIAIFMCLPGLSG
jgi:hypothetical protein